MLGTGLSDLLLRRCASARLRTYAFCLGGAGTEGQTYFDELHVQLGILLHVLKQVSVECLHL